MLGLVLPIKLGQAAARVPMKWSGLCIQAPLPESLDSVVHGFNLRF